MSVKNTSCCPSLYARLFGAGSNARSQAGNATAKEHGGNLCCMPGAKLAVPKKNILYNSIRTTPQTQAIRLASLYASAA